MYEGHLRYHVGDTDATVKAGPGYLAAYTVISDGSNAGSVSFSDDTTEVWNTEVLATAGDTVNLLFPAPGLYFGTSLEIALTNIKKVCIAYY